MLDRTPLSERARGKWRDILTSLGVPASVINGKSQGCPFCGSSGPRSDRFTFDDKSEGDWICRKCGAGHGAQFVERWLKCDFKTAALEIEKHIGTARVVAPKTIQGEEGHKAAMSGLWRKGRPLMGEDLASRYLRARGIVLPSWPAALRFVEELAYRDEKTSTLVSYLPGMIANFRAPDDLSGTIYRSYLQEPGIRSAVVAKKCMAMPGRIPVGGAVRLGPVAETMGVSTGIETSLSAAIMFSLPVWATCTDGNLIKWVPPNGCKNIIIFGDLDASFSGQQTFVLLSVSLDKH